MDYKFVSGVALKFVRNWLNYYDSSRFRTAPSAEILAKCNIQLENQTHNVLSWDDYMHLCRAMSEHVAAPYAFTDLIHGTVIDGDIDPIYRHAIGLITSPKMLMRLQSTLISPRIFRGMRCIQTYPEADRFKIILIAPADFPDCTLFFEACRAGIIVTPRIIGSGDNKLVYSEISSHQFTAEYIFPKSNTLVSRVKSLFFFLRREKFEQNLNDEIRAFEERSRSIQLESNKLQSLLFKQQKLALLGEMTSTIAHEINNPLTVVSSHLQELSKKLEAGEVDVQSFKSRIEVALSSVDQISKIVDSSYGFNRQRNEMERFEVSELLDDVSRLCTPKCNRERLQLIVNTSKSKGIRLSAIRHEIIQVLCNLVLNSIDACSDLESGKIEISCSEKSDSNLLEIQISDNGIGIEPENGKLIFDAFKTFRKDGTGLGLSLSKILIEKNKGTLSLVNFKNPTIFSVKLPA